MAKASTKAKMKYNRRAYRRYEFNLKIDSKLNAIVERYKSISGSNMSQLIKTSLCGHFGISPEDADCLYSPYYITKDGIVENTGIDKYFEQFQKAAES
jgi:hypothetical protein